VRTQVHKWGNSMALRIPSAFAAELGLRLDAPVDLTMEDGRLVITPATSRPYQLGELLQGVTPENVHSEQDFGPAAGGEAW